jgi:hypothetical protein
VLDNKPEAALAERLKELQAENARLKEILRGRRQTAANTVSTWVWELGPGKSMRLFQTGKRTYYLIADDNHTYLGASSNETGESLWRTLFAEKLPVAGTAGAWSLQDQAQEIVLTWSRKVGSVAYTFDRKRGLLVRREATSNPGGKAAAPRGPSESAPPVLSDVPYLKQLFSPPKTPKASKDAPPTLPGEGEVKMFTLRHVRAAEVGRILKELFPKNTERDLRITAHERTNSLLVRGHRMDLEVIERIITRLELSSTARMKENEDVK